MQPDQPMLPFSRRDLLRGAVAGTGAVVLSQLSQTAGAAPQSERHSVIGMPFEPRENVRMGLIGCGGGGAGVVGGKPRGGGFTGGGRWGVVKDAAVSAQATVERAGQHPPAVYANGERDFENLLKRDDVDFAYLATPWNWHVPMALAAMNSGKHAFVEVPAAATIEDC